MPYARTSLRREKRDLREKMRSMGLGYRDIAGEFARRYRLRPRAAWRDAYGWSLQETADRINDFRGDTGLDPGGLAGMTAPHLSEYENWPGHGPDPSGRRPTPYLLAVLAAVYGCAVGELVDLADRERLPPSDLLILDKYSSKPSNAAGLHNGAEHASRPPGRPSSDTAPAIQGSDDRLGDLLMPEQDGALDVQLGRRKVPLLHRVDVVTVTDGVPDLWHQVEILRQMLNSTLSDGAMAEASLEDWEKIALRHGRASRHRPAGAFLADLCADLADLEHALERHRSASALRRLTRVTAQMSGLMCLTFCKLDDRPAFRWWARTARLAADEAGDPETSSWVLAQEAYGHYYSGDLAEAVNVARCARAIGGTAPCAGAALAAGLEARAHAAMGDQQETRTALERAEGVTAQLSGDELIPSAFGYNEAQLRFHAGSAYTSLRDAKAALEAQDRALALCMPGDYTDWALTRLDRAMCMTYTGGITDALAYAADTVQSLNGAQSKGIITLRAHEILSALPEAQQELPSAREFRDLLMQETEQEEVPGR